jgi:hypothetical protein
MSSNFSNKRAASAPAESEIVSVGTASQTKKSRSSAWERFDEYQNELSEDILLEIQSCDDDEAKCDIIKQRLISFADWLVKNPLKKKHKPDDSVSSSSVLQYFGQVKEELKEKTPTLALWVDHETKWYTQLRSNLDTGVERRLQRGEEDYKDPSCRALHLRCETGKLRTTERHFLEKKGVDLESIINSILSYDSKKKNTAYRDRAQLLTTFYGVGRGGETKFLRWSEFQWDDFYQNLEGVWTRMKTLLQHVVSFQCCRLGYLCDLYHSFGCYFAVEDGLFRCGSNDDQTNKRNNRYIFPQLWAVSDATVAKNLTTLIRAHSDECFKVLNQSRSIRIGANTELAMHCDISPEQQRLAGGFAAGNNSDVYTRMNPDLCLPAANALAQWPSATTGKMVYPPSLLSVLASGAALPDHILKVINHLYLITVDEFKENGKLRPFLETCTASLIMYFPDMLHDFGEENPVVVKLKDSVISAKVASTGQTATVLLTQWAKIIKADYDAKNSLLPNCSNATTLQTVQAQSVLINQLIIHHQELLQKVDALATEIVGLRAAIAEQPRALVGPMAVAMSSAIVATAGSASGHTGAGAHHEVASVEQGQTATPTALPVASVRNDEPRNDQEVSAHLPIELVRIIEQFRQSLDQADDVKKNILLRWTNLADVAASNKALTIREVIEIMVKENLIRSPTAVFSKLSPPRGINSKNTGLFKASMVVVDMILTPKQKVLLSMTRQERDVTSDFSKILRGEAYEIERATFAKMKELDKKERGTIPTVLGIGNRYKAYCLKMGISVEGDATLPGQTSLTNFFKTDGS